MSWEDEADALMTEAQKDQQQVADATSWNPEEGDKLTGTLIRGDIVPTKYGDAHIMNVLDKDGKVWTVWCTPTILKSQLDDQHPAKGKGVSILYNGKKQPATAGGNEYKSFTMISEATDHQYWMDVMKAHLAKGEEALQSSGSSGHSSAPFDDDEVPY